MLNTELIYAMQEYADSVAVFENGRSFTYRQLNNRAMQIYNALQNSHVPMDGVVLINAKKSFNMLAAMLACIYLQCPYVPLEDAQPIKRINYVIRNSRVSIVLTDNCHNFSSNTDFKIPVFNIEKLGVSSASEYAFTPQRSMNSDKDTHLLIFYTSGSTGFPKAVVITHENALNFIHWAKHYFSLEFSDNVAAFAPWHFDLSIFDIFVTLLSGAHLTIVPNHIKAFPLATTRWIIDHAITHLYLVPTALMLLVRKGNWAVNKSSMLKSILFAGEKYPLQDLCQLRKIYPSIKLTNLYGPTETNVCTYYAVPALEQLSTLVELPLGQAIDHLDVYLLDPVEVAGVKEGELCCRGPSVSVGYLRDGQLVSDSDKWYQEMGQRCYRTGDWVKETKQGLIYIGRQDRQIKRNGYRIDLTEIESCLRKHTGITECAVLYENNQLIAFIVAANAINFPSLAKLCADFLPGYMCPDKYMALSALPKTYSGKIDSIALQSMLEENKLCCV